MPVLINQVRHPERQRRIFEPETDEGFQLNGQRSNGSPNLSLD